MNISFSSEGLVKQDLENVYMRLEWKSIQGILKEPYK